MGETHGRGLPKCVTTHQECWRRANLELQSQSVQVAFQLPRIQKLNRVQAQVPRAFQVQRAVVDEDALFRLPLRKVKRQLVNLRVRFGYSQEAGTEEDGKIFAQTKFLNPVEVQLSRFVVECGQKDIVRSARAAQ